MSEGSAAGSRPRISIVVPSLDQGEYLEETLRSVLDQAYPELEIIVMDGGSVDGSVEIVKRYERQLTYWRSGPDRGQSDALNRGFSRATGDVFAWLNSDDRYLPGVLSWVGEQFANDPSLNWLCGGLVHIDALGKQLRRLSPFGVTSEWATAALFKGGESLGGGVYQPATFFSRRFWEACGPLKESLHFCMDRDLWLEGRARGFQPRFVDRVLAEFRFHADSKTESRKPSFEFERARVHLRKAFRPGFRAIKNLQLAKQSMVSGALLWCDSAVQEEAAMRALRWYLVAMVLSPSMLRRRLYTLRLIARCL